MKQLKIELIVEKQDGLLWGRIENVGDFMPTGQGESIDDLITNIKESIEDYIENEGTNDKKWNKVNLETIEFDILYDLEAFFIEHDYLNLSKIAERAIINRSLLSQYANGVKKASADQAKKIEDVIHELGNELKSVKIFA